MAAEPSVSRGKNMSRKRKWKKVSLKDEEIFDFKEDGLISLEELTDYQLDDLRSSDVTPTAKKRAKIVGPNSKKHSAKSIGKMKDSSSKTKKTDTKKRNEKKQSVSSKDISKVVFSETECTNLEEHSRSENNRNDDVNSKPESSSSNIEFKCDMSDWIGLGVPDSILAAMSEKGFTTPTPIQAACLPLSIFQYQDIIGAAETGSGKTMAFVLPILTHILELKNKELVNMDCSSEHERDHKKPLYALILTPTRELALQVFKNIKNLTKFIPVHCAAVVGGLSVQKQERLLRKCPEVVVGTPGRLLSKIKDGELSLNQIRFLVIDEVDRMLEFGHFKEAAEILRLLSLTKSKWQTFLFSATLTVPQYHKKWSGQSKDESGKESVQNLVDKAKVSSKAKVIDLTRKNIAAEQIKQQRAICTDSEKDIYLFYVLLSHPGRTLIFVNSINCTRKITNFLKVLGKNPLQLHAGKQQKQRLKALDRFMSDSNAIMVATDVAARGLDIPNVDTVIHYHLPKDPKLYIHRSGRTARANRCGESIILEGPQDFREYKKICALMKLTSDLPSLEVDDRIIPDIKKRVNLARDIEKEEHQQKKKSSEKNWFDRAAKSLDLEIEEREDYEDGRTRKQQNKKLNALKKELQQLLQRPLVPKGFSGSYITKSGKLEMLKV